jgi:hypothetical protein
MVCGSDRHRSGLLALPRTITIKMRQDHGIRSLPRSHPKIRRDEFLDGK